MDKRNPRTHCQVKTIDLSDNVLIVCDSVREIKMLVCLVYDSLNFSKNESVSM